MKTESPITPRQTALPIFVSQRTVLVDVGTVRAKFGCDAETVFAMVDNGQLRWAFDVSVEGAIRDLRFWAAEVIAPELVAKATPEEAIASILGGSPTIRRGEIERQWICSAQHVMRLIRAGEFTLIGAGLLQRLSLAAFLQRRLQR